MAIYKDKEGHKLYPVCSWERNQHKLYNAMDRAHNSLYDALENGTTEDIDRCEHEIDRIGQVMSAFERFIVDGIVYARWEDACIIKDYIWAYNARH